MRMPLSRVMAGCVCAVLLSGYMLAQSTPTVRKPVDLHSAIALSQAQLYGTTGLTSRADRQTPVADVLMLVPEQHWSTVRSRLAAQGMTIAFEDAKSGYIRVTIPQAGVRPLFEWPEIDAVRVDGLAAFDTRLQPQVLQSSLGFRDGGDLSEDAAEVVPTTKVVLKAVPLLTPERARRYPINTDQDMGVTNFREANPTFDGRGVGIGVLETTWLPIDQPSYAEGLALDGTRRRKVLRYLHYPSANSEEVAAPFSDWFDCKSPICRVQDRVMRLPAVGRYRIADFSLSSPYPAACGGKARFAILQRQDTKSLFIDTNRDFDFIDEQPVVDFNDVAWNPRSIALLRCGSGQQLKTVVTVDTDSRLVRLHPFTNRHATMTTTVAAGSAVADNLAMGVAPNASLVAVDAGPESLLSQALEGAITLARDPDVDVLFAAIVVQTPLGTSSSFDARAFDRIAEAYNKPILISAGNYMTGMAATPAPSGRATISVGQYISSATVEGQYGIRQVDTAVMGSTVGPAWDGSSRPDFIVPSRRVAAFPCVQGKRVLATQFDLPACYTLSGGTSAASPSAAGAVALLISAAKQRGLTPTAAEIKAALIASAHLMPGLPTHTQGVGLVDVPRAWELLQRKSAVGELDVEGELRHGVVDLMRGARAKGLVWMSRSSESQTLTLTLHPARGTALGTLAVRSEGDLGVSTPTSVDPNVTTRVPVTLAPPPVGRVQSSWISFADKAGTIVGRALATAARPMSFSAPAYQNAWQDDVATESHRGTVFTVPTGTTGFLVEVNRLRGDIGPTLSNPMGVLALSRAYWSDSTSFSGAALYPTGEYAGVLLNPVAGDWGIATINRSAVRLDSPNPPGPGSIAVRMTAFRTVCSLVQRSSQGSNTRIRVAVDDVFAKPVNGGMLVTPARRKTERFTLRDEFERRPVTIDVKPGTAAVHVSAGTRAGAEAVMLQLFDCSQGHCIPVIQTVPGEPSPVLNIRQPRPGTWRVFAVPVHTPTKGIDVEVNVLQAAEAELAALAHVTEKNRPSARQLFEGDVAALGDGSDYLALRTDERAKVNRAGWAAISMCAIHDGPQSR